MSTVTPHITAKGHLTVSTTCPCCGDAATPTDADGVGEVFAGLVDELVTTWDGAHVGPLEGDEGEMIADATDWVPGLADPDQGICATPYWRTADIDHLAGAITFSGLSVWGALYDDEGDEVIDVLVETDEELTVHYGDTDDTDIDPGAGIDDGAALRAEILGRAADASRALGNAEAFMWRAGQLSATDAQVVRAQLRAVWAALEAIVIAAGKATKTA